MTASGRTWLGLAGVLLASSAFSLWWTGEAQRSVGQDMARLARPGDIHMLSSQTCGICAEARAWMTAYKVPFTECTIERDAACRAALDASGSPGTPVIVVRGKAQLGFDPARLRTALAASG